MEKEWILIYATNYSVKAQIIKAMLLENDIECILIDKQDSSYISIGEVELYTHQNDILKAKHLINLFNINE